MVIFFKIEFSFSFEESSLRIQIQNLGWNGQAVWMYEAILWFAVAYILLCKLNYGYHNQARFH